MKEVARIALPGHAPDGGFDHAAVDPALDRLYVAHPSNDAVEVIDLAARRHLRSLTGLRGVAGVWVDPAGRWLFTSNRGEDTASVFRLEPRAETPVLRIPTGSRPNGLAYDTTRHRLLVAGVGNAERSNAPPTLTVVEIPGGEIRARIVLPGRTRWALYHPPSDRFYVNVADPASIVALRGDRPSEIARTYPIPARGPHGLEQDPRGDRLYCACDDGTLFSLDPTSGEVARLGPLSGAPDVVWINPRTDRLYVAVGAPGCVDRFELGPFRPTPATPTSDDAHTLTVDVARAEVHVFLPSSHEDLVLSDP